MSSCTFFGRLPVLSIDSAQKKRYIIASTMTIGEEEPVELKMALHVFLDVPIQRETLIQVVDIPFANNGEEHITLGADARNIEQLGDGCPSDPDYLASCPDVSIQPKLTVIGVVGNPTQAGTLSTFTLAGNSYINGGYQAFTIKVRVDRDKNRWSNFKTPATGNTVHINGWLYGREQPNSGLLIIDLGHITYITARANPTNSPKSPVKSSTTDWASKQISAKRMKRKRTQTEDENEDRAEGSSTSNSQATQSG